MARCARWGLRASIVLLAAVTLTAPAGAAVIWDNGTLHEVMFDEDGPGGSDPVQMMLGFLSGDAGAGLEQRWALAPFYLTQQATITEVRANWFADVPGDEIRYVIFSRTGSDAPASGDEVASGVLGSYTQLAIDDPRQPGWPLYVYTGLDIQLAAGDYYITIYGADSGGDPATINWYTGGDLQDEAIEWTDAKGYLGMWRSAQFPTPGFVEYSNADIQPVGVQDPDDVYNPAFSLHGILGAVGTIGGTVTDVGTGQPIAGAVVSAGTESGVTDALGQYEFPITAGTYTVSANHRDYQSDSQAGVVVAEAATTTVDFQLSFIEGRVFLAQYDGNTGNNGLDADTGFPSELVLAYGNPVITTGNGGKYNEALDADADGGMAGDSVLYAGSNVPATGTIEMWVTAPVIESRGNHAFWAANEDWTQGIALIIHTAYGMKFRYLPGTDITLPYTWTPGSWHHVAMTWSASGTQAYIDG